MGLNHRHHHSPCTTVDWRTRFIQTELHYSTIEPKWYARVIPLETVSCVPGVSFIILRFQVDHGLRFRERRLISVWKFNCYSSAEQKADNQDCYDLYCKKKLHLWLLALTDVDFTLLRVSVWSRRVFLQVSGKIIYSWTKCLITKC